LPTRQAAPLMGVGVFVGAGVFVGLGVLVGCGVRVGAGVVGTAVGETGAAVATALLVHAVRNSMAASNTGRAVRGKLDMDLS